MDNNHRPCLSNLSNSNEMSRAIGLAFAHVELANMALEDVFVAELFGDKDDSKPIDSQFNNSLGHLKEITNALSGVCRLMLCKTFQDMPILAKTNLGGLAVAEGIPTSSPNSDIAAETMQNRFLGLTSMFEKNIEVLNLVNQDFVAKVGRSIHPNKFGIHSEPKGNNELKFKNEFVDLYMTWAYFQQVFLKSSLISNELLYPLSGSSSLVQDQEPLPATV